MRKFLEKAKAAYHRYKAELALVDWGDVTVRALKTFAQVALTYAFTALAGVDFSEEISGTFWLGFALSAGSAGVSAAWNSVLIPVLNCGKHAQNEDDTNG